MKCAVHAELDAAGFCRNCGKALCAQCTREVRGALYCEECLAAFLAPHPAAAAGSNPGLALALGFVPGLGAVYNGESLKALIHILIFGGLIALLNSDLGGGYEAMFGILLAAFCLYMPIEAYRTAKARQTGQAPSGFAGLGEGNRPLGGIILIALGVLFLLGNMGILEADWIRNGWPLVLIGIGAWLLWRRSRGTA